MTISDEAAEAAATALHAHYAYENEGVEDYPSDEYICCARAALEAAAPYIRAGALEDAAERYTGDDHGLTSNGHVRWWLGTRAVAERGA